MVECLLCAQPRCPDGAGDVSPFLREEGRKVEEVGEIGESKREKGFLRAGYPALPVCFPSSAGTGGIGELIPAGAEPPFMNAFFSDANDPFRCAKNPEAELIEVPGPTSDDAEPLLCFPSLVTSTVFGVGTPAM